MKNPFLTSIFVLALIFSATAQNTINSYEYWFDNDFVNRVVTPVTPVAQLNVNSNIPTVGLANGIHTFNFRTLDNEGLSSSVLSEYFYKVPAQVTSSNKEIVVYEYWFDNDFANAVSVNTTQQQQINISELLTTSGLNNGIHTFNIRFKDNADLWSSVLSEYFYKIPETTLATNPEIITYEYWFDNDFANAQEISTTAQQQILLNELISTTGLNNGIHTFNIRFKDNANLWSSVLSEYFYKVPETIATGNKEIIEMEYWFDNDFLNAQTSAITPQQQVVLNDQIPTAIINNGIHTFHVRFKDNSGFWSSVLSHYFYKTPVQTVLNNLITEYRYWLDQDFQNAVYESVSPGVQQLVLVDSLDFTMIPKNEYVINFQFKDTTGLWSSVISDTIVKAPLPIPIFAADSTAFCDQGTVTFINNSIDGDEYLWDFGDGNSSTDEEPTHSYAQPGSYTVSLTAYDLTTPVDSTVAQNELVIVYETPSNDLQLVGNDSICENEDVEIIAEGIGDYLWSTGESTQSIITDEAGDFWVTVYNTEFASCYSESDTVSITLMPLPYSNFSYTNDSLEVSFDNLSQDGDSYSWNFGDNNTSQDYEPIHSYDEDDNYEVYLVTYNWCSSDTSFMTVELEYLSTSHLISTNLEIQVYPNPTNLEAKISFSESQKSVYLKVYDSRGSLVEEISKNQVSEILIGQDYEPGVYLIHIFTENFKGVLRIVKQ